MSGEFCPKNMPPSTSAAEPKINLSRDELLKLLSVFEGELQARDEVIEILKLERTNHTAIQERYGLGVMPWQALQRDAASLVVTTNDQVAGKTTQNLHKITQHQKESYKKMKQALLGAEQANQKLAMEINKEKRKHQDYMLKSDDFVNLLEEERERLKFALKREKEAGERREIEMNKTLKTHKVEVSKLKSLSLILVDERKLHLSTLAEHKQQIIELEGRAKKAKIKCKESKLDSSMEKELSMQLECHFEDQNIKFSQEEVNTKLQEEKEKNKILEEKIEIMAQRLKNQKTVQRNLQKTDDQLWKIHEELDKDNNKHGLLLKEIELLRQKVKDMEQNAEINIQAQEDCQEIRQKLESEIALTRTLRSQLTALQNKIKAQKDLQKSIDHTDFRFDELQMKFEVEKKKSNDMKEQLQKMKSKMTELDQHETIIQQTEEKMNKLKQRIVLLSSQKKCGDDQVHFLLKKNQQLKKDSELEKEKITDITEKFLTESKRVLKLQEQLSQEKQNWSSQIVLANEKLKQAKEELTYSTQADKTNDKLRRQVTMLKARLDQLEAESKNKESTLSNTTASQHEAALQSSDLGEIMQKFQAADEMCGHLSEQLHAKTKLCETLKKKLAQASQNNNNNNITRTPSTPVVNSASDNKSTTLSKSNMKTDKITLLQPSNKPESNSQSCNLEKPDIVSKNSQAMHIKPTRVNLGTASQLPGCRTAFLSSPASKKSPMSPTTSLRSSKVTPLNFQTAKKSLANGTCQKPSTLKQEHLKNKETPIRSTVAKDGQTEDQVVKSLGEGQQKAAIASTKSAGNGKRIKVSNQDSKVSKQSSAPKCFGTFQGQKDFTELQKKWNSKIGK